MPHPRFRITQGKGNEFFFNLTAANGEIILQSQRYASHSGAVSGVTSVKANAGGDDRFQKREARDGAEAVRHARPAPPPEPPATETQTRAERETWSELMRVTFGLDVLACPRCGGRMKHLGTILDPRVARRILQHVGLPARAPPELPARDPPPFWEVADACIEAVRQAARTRRCAGASPGLARFVQIAKMHTGRKSRGVCSPRRSAPLGAPGAQLRRERNYDKRRRPLNRG